jgi:hypothetical protein
MTAIDKEIAREMDPARCRRKENQAWEMAGCAWQDNDKKDAARWTEEARKWTARRKELL